MEGINDTLGSDPTKYAPKDMYEIGYATFLQWIKNNIGCEIVTMTSHWNGSGTTNTLQGGLNDYVAIQKKVSLAEKIQCIDIHQVWLDHWINGVANFGQGNWLASTDACHPTPLGYEEGIAVPVFNELFIYNQILIPFVKNKNVIVNYSNVLCKLSADWHLNNITQKYSYL
jgi:hypothetical protein